MAIHKLMGLHLAVFLMLTAGICTAQQPVGSPPPAPDSSTATLKVTSRLTLENVTVTDAKGKPVHGLKQSDFTVKEDGKPQEIKNFEEYGAEIPSAQPAPPALPPHVYTNAQSPGPQSGAVNILLLDTLNIGLARQAYVRIKAISYLKSMPPGTKVAIFELGRELRIVQGFTTDRAVLLAAMNSFVPTMAVNPQGPHSPCEIGQFLNTRSRATTDALDAIAAFGSGIKGRKNLIWFTPGLPQITAYERLAQIECLVNFRAEMQRAYGLLTAAQVAVYPIDPHGLVPGGTPAEDVGELALMESNTVRDLTYFSMQDIAANTGGRAYYNRNDIDAAIGEAIATGADYYSLSYVPPPSKYDDKYHTIDVKVDRPGLHLQYREGYTDIDLAKPPVDKNDAKNAPAPAPDSEFHAAMDHGAAPSAQLRFDVKISPSTAPAKPGDPPVAGMLNPELNGKPLVRYDLLFAIPADQITLAEGADGTRKGSVEIDATAYGGDGTKLNVVRGTANFAGSLDSNPKPFQALVQLDLPPGEVFVRAGVLDVPSQKMGTLEVPETVTQQSSAGTALPATVTQQSSARTALPAKTAKILSGAQMEQLLTSNQDKADGKVARQLADVELSERVSAARMARWEKNFPGSKTREQLIRLADITAFFNPPEEDVIRDPAPDAATQTKIFALGAEFAKTMFTRLPDFYATRTTTHFDDEPEVEQLTTRGGAGIVAQKQIFVVNVSEIRPMRVIGTYSMTVTFRQGSEIHEKAGKGSKPEPSQTGLRTQGEFGPILGIVMGDAIRSQSVTWSRWEQGESGPIAVFRYFVPQDQSTYTTQIPDGSKLTELHPGYHGEIAIDPAKGSILHISVVTDMAPPHQAIAMAMLVEYAPVTMGDRTYICPVHGVAYSNVPLTILGPVREAGAGPVPFPAALQATQNSAEITRTELNDTVFTQYHRFGSEIRIDADSTSQKDGNLQ